MTESTSHPASQIDLLAARMVELEQELANLRHRLWKLEVVHAGATSLSDDLELAPTLDAFCSRLAALLPRVALAVALGTADGSVHFPRANGALARLATGDDPGNSAAFAQVLCQDKPLLLQRKDAELLAPSLASEEQALFLAPLRATGDASLGVLIAARPAALGFSPEEQELLCAAAGAFASALHKVTLFQQTKALAITDPLTKLYNRRHLQERLDHEVARALRYSHALSVLLIDIDNFKLYNDLNGHLQGDAALRELAALLRRHTRQADLLARFGGEEFVVLLPEIDAASARAVAEKLRQTVEQTPFKGEEVLPGGKLTISAGLATLPSDACESVELLDLADRGLYLAKRWGRNRVCHFLDEE
ncbi:MAG: GGDEF domain-containing protein [bacterium]|jgi:diguanylate cyclase (GGDEF)-like protein|nr:GGDEF domain-containing protein [candidate division KSB1 bacterium]MDH7561211.1 GGDEF domain-containing protein [bacterium]